VAGLIAAGAVLAAFAAYLIALPVLRRREPP
jgi:ABC-type branched-subunit amino acid transport system permease subunit